MTSRALRRLGVLLAKGEAAAAKEALQAAERAIGRAASKGVVHRNAASRRISRLAHAVALSARPAAK